MALDPERLMREYAPRLAGLVDSPTRRAASEPEQEPVVVEQADDTEPDVEPEQTGVMVAFYLDDATAAQLALASPETCCCDCCHCGDAAVGEPDACDCCGLGCDCGDCGMCGDPAMQTADVQCPTCKKMMAKAMPPGQPCAECGRVRADLGDGTDGINGPLDAEEPDELHLTLAYLGTAGIDVTVEQLPTLLDAVTAWAGGQDPITGTTSGIGLFNNADETVTYASVDAPALPRARQALVDALDQAGIAVSGEHGYTPHITLAYGDARSADVPRLPLTFDTVTVAFAGQQALIPLKSAPPAPAESARAHTSPRSDVTATAGSIVDSSIWSPFVVTNGGRTYVTGPATTEHAAMWDTPPSPNKHMLWMQGRFVGADRPNRNGAFWSTADLELGKPTVVHGPLNWLHEDKHVIGTIADARFVPGGPGGSPQPIAAAAAPMGSISDPHISALAAIWQWIYPGESAVVQMASDAGVLAYSMECIAESVQCVRDEAKDLGCGESFPYMQFASGQMCSHLKERSSVRRLVNPTFLGGAVIVPPTRPGWADANAQVMRRTAAWAEKAFEQAGRPAIEASTWELLMASVASYTGVPQ